MASVLRWHSRTLDWAFAVSIPSQARNRPIYNTVTLIIPYRSVTALLVPTDAKPPVNEEGRDDEDELLRRIGSGRSRWASFTADDLDAIAPWLSEHIDKKMEGMGLGL